MFLLNLLHLRLVLLAIFNNSSTSSRAFEGEGLDSSLCYLQRSPKPYLLRSHLHFKVQSLASSTISSAAFLLQGRRHRLIPQSTHSILLIQYHHRWSPHQQLRIYHIKIYYLQCRVLVTTIHFQRRKPKIQFRDLSLDFLSMNFMAE